MDSSGADVCTRGVCGCVCGWLGWGGLIQSDTATQCEEGHQSDPPCGEQRASFTLLSLRLTQGLRHG